MRGAGGVSGYSFLVGSQFVIPNNGYRRVRGENGDLATPSSGLAYVFDGDRLVTFPIRMREDDFIAIRNAKLTAYADVEAFLRRYERSPGS